MKEEKYEFNNEEPSEVFVFREKMAKQGFDLVNITTLCELKLGTSGWANGFNEPDESIHHVQIWYREEQVATISSNRLYVLDDDSFACLAVNDDDPLGNDFIIYRKVLMTEAEKKGLLNYYKKERDRIKRTNKIVSGFNKIGN